MLSTACELARQNWHFINLLSNSVLSPESDNNNKNVGGVGGGIINGKDKQHEEGKYLKKIITIFAIKSNCLI